jgi:signal peptidase II
MAGEVAVAGSAPEAAKGRAGYLRPAFWLPVAPLVALDLWSKAAVFAYLETEHPADQKHRVWSGVVDFDLVHWHNSGTIWGLFQGYNLPLVILRCAAVVIIVHYVAKLPRASRVLPVVLGVILAGALGNLYDNFTEPKGGVRDFLSFTFHVGDWSYQFPAFNVADSCITVGVVTLVISILFGPRQRK